MRTPDGTQHIAWTCLNCEFINCWNWAEDEGGPLSLGIFMTCDNCGRVTQMILIEEDREPDKVALN
jgi:hypothetical protein